MARRKNVVEIEILVAQLKHRPGIGENEALMPGWPRITVRPVAVAVADGDMRHIHSASFEPGDCHLPKWIAANFRNHSYASAKHGKIMRENCRGTAQRQPKSLD